MDERVNGTASESLEIRDDAGSSRAAGDPAWRWELANPLGCRVRVAEVEGVARARFATRPQAVLADGEEKIFACVLPPWPGPKRGGLARPELAAAARRLIDETTGPSADMLSYGWLSNEALTWCTNDLRFETLRVHTVLVGDAAPQAGPQGREVDAVLPAGVEVLADVDSRIERLHGRCSAGWGVSGLRKESYLRWRLMEHPERPYTLLGVEGGGGELAGHAVLRESDVLGAVATTIVDWLVPDDDEDAGRALLEGVRAMARHAGTVEVRATFPEWSRWFERFQDWGFLVHSSDLCLASRRTHPRHEIYWLRDNWWIQPLDLDRL